VNDRRHGAREARRAHTAETTGRNSRAGYHLSSLAHRLWLRILRIGCWWRGKHAGEWARGYWTCSRCGAKWWTTPPPGAVLTDEGMQHIYTIDHKRQLRRVDKVRGGKKVRRKKRAEMERIRLLREGLLTPERRGS